MSSFQQHCSKPKFQGKIPIPNGIGTYQLDDKRWLRFSMDIDEKDIIENIGIEHHGLENQIPFASRFSEAIFRKSVSEALDFDFSSIIDEFSEDENFAQLLAERETIFFPIAYFAFLLAIEDFRGDCLLGDHESGILVCRCFKVKQSEIQNYLNRNEDDSWDDLVCELKASSACGTCFHDVQDLYLKGRSLSEKDVASVQVQDQQLVKQTQKLIDIYYSFSPTLAEKLKIEITYVSAGQLDLILRRESGSLDQAQLERSLRDYLKQKLGDKVLLTLTWAF